MVGAPRTGNIGNAWNSGNAGSSGNLRRTGTPVKLGTLRTSKMLGTGGIGGTVESENGENRGNIRNLGYRRPPMIPAPQGVTVLSWGKGYSCTCQGKGNVSSGKPPNPASDQIINNLEVEKLSTVHKINRGPPNACFSNYILYALTLKCLAYMAIQTWQKYQNSDIKGSKAKESSILRVQKVNCKFKSSKNIHIKSSKGQM